MRMLQYDAVRNLFPESLALQGVGMFCFHLFSSWSVRRGGGVNGSVKPIARTGGNWRRSPERSRMTLPQGTVGKLRKARRATSTRHKSSALSILASSIRKRRTGSQASLSLSCYGPAGIPRQAEQRMQSGAMNETSRGMHVSCGEARMRRQEVLYEFVVKTQKVGLAAARPA